MAQTTDPGYALQSILNVQWASMMAELQSEGARQYGCWTWVGALMGQAVLIAAHTHGEAENANLQRTALDEVAAVIKKHFPNAPQGSVKLVDEDEGSGA